MKPVKKIVDTTLRDGEQCPGLVFLAEDKIRLALILDEIGVHEMEVGVVGNETDTFSYLSKIMEKKKQSKVSLWCRMIPNEVEEACRLEPDLIHIGVPVSYVQIYSKLKKNKIWVQREVTACLKKASLHGIPVTLGMEDSTRADLGFVLCLMKQAAACGVTTIRLADTVGTLSPERAENFIKEIRTIERNMKLEIHEHNDLGMAVANSLIMAKAGGELIDCTLLGLGERVGNCNLYDFVHAGERIFQLGVEKAQIKRAEEVLIEILKRGIR